MAGWTSPLNLLREELTQRRDEGVAIPDTLLQRIAELHAENDAWNYAAIDPLYDQLMALPEDAALAAREPNDLAAIRALRPDGPRVLAWSPKPEELIDRLHGAWTGRCTGCALGKPVEGMGMRRRHDELVGRKEIKKYLQNRGDWPLKDYFSTRDAGDGLRVGCEASTREKVAYMEPDDDIHYSLVGLGVLEENGPGFTWNDIGRFWLNHIPITAICTAETQAVTNLQNRSCRGHDGSATPAFTRRFRNPYREWIGAQIRADGWAFACAGKPELAAEFAWRDAHWTHERNGIYGEMLFAAIQAAAFVEHDPRRLVEIGLSEIPRDCRLAVLIRDVLRWVDECRDWESCMARVEEACGTMSAVHTNNNAAICVLALFYGRMDTLETQAISVMCGLDTDCNGATVGSIVGAAAGRKAFRRELAAPLNDLVKPNMVGFAEVSMRALAERTAAVWAKTDAYWNERHPPAKAAAAR
ncbi:MAG TPA: ADP-ribosylglycohydrolase family protein [Planctomycetota bacterium]|nr:ADP-ribosylglycohydrolase family protein [Planctomycetota bacterium]